jgi:hypothetical protein
LPLALLYLRVTVCSPICRLCPSGNTL